jgi:DNA-binding response OmpR family regulator
MTTDRKPRILVADDDKDMRRMVELTFTDEPFELTFAFDGQEAVDIFEQVNPDIVLLDVRMPRMDGFQACRAIRETLGKKDVVIIMLTSLSEGDDLKSGFQGGADDYITKPFSIGNLKSRVKSWMLRKGIPA